ncbi:MAG: hypothetical protein KDK91_19390 [Gammaproteobacteria bacterium]|nr:hypothetical protein [Gammaproteobacteria bacterium]
MRIELALSFIINLREHMKLKPRIALRPRPRPVALGVQLGSDYVRAAGFGADVLDSVDASTSDVAVGGRALFGPVFATLDTAAESSAGSGGPLGRIVGALKQRSPRAMHGSVLCLADDLVEYRQLDYDPAQYASVERAILAQMPELVDPQAQARVVDYLPLSAAGPDTGLTRVLLVVAALDRVESLLEQIEATGLSVAAVEVVPVSVLRALNAPQARQGPLAAALSALGDRILVTYIDLHQTTVLAVERVDGHWTLAMHRSIRLGKQDLLAPIRTSMDLRGDEAERLVCRMGVGAAASSPTGPRIGDDGPADRPASEWERESDLNVREVLYQAMRPVLHAFANELTRVALYYASQRRGSSPGGLLLLGDPVCWRGMLDALSAQVGLPARRLALPAAPTSNSTLHALIGMPEGDGQTTGAVCLDYSVAAAAALRDVVEWQGYPDAAG